MSRDYEPIGDGRRSGPGTRIMLLLLLVAFAGGAVLTGWLITRYNLFGRGVPAAPQQQAATLAGTAPRDSGATPPMAAGRPAAPVRPGQPGPAPVAAAPGQDSAAQAATLTAATTLRVAELEARLARISADAGAAADEAGRAEALLALAAARRALDQGLPLGAAGDALARRFAGSAPAAIRRLDAAARTPVTREELLFGLSELRVELLQPSSAGGMFGAFGRGLSELFVLRRAGTPPPAAEARLDRAGRLVAAGNVAAALEEIQRLPNPAAATDWRTAARAYIEARAALDQLELRILNTPAPSVTPPSAGPAQPAADAAG